MHRCIVCALNVFKRDYSIPRSIQNLECLDAELCAEVVHWTDNDANELVEFYFSVTIYVEALEKCGQILRLNLNAKVLDCLIELIWVESTTVIVVHDLELAAKADDSSAAATL